MATENWQQYTTEADVGKKVFVFIYRKIKRSPVRPELNTLPRSQKFKCLLSHERNRYLFRINDNLQDVANFGENRIGITTTYLTMYLNNYDHGVILLWLMTSLKGKYYRFYRI